MKKYVLYLNSILSFKFLYLKNFLYLWMCFRILVVKKTYVINLLGLLITHRILFIYCTWWLTSVMELNLLISSLCSWLKHYLRQIYVWLLKGRNPSTTALRWFAGGTAHIVFIHIPSVVKPVHIFMVTNKDSKTFSMTELCLHHKYIYIYIYNSTRHFF